MSVDSSWPRTALSLLCILCDVCHRMPVRMTPTAGYVMTGGMSSVVIVVPESSMYSAQVQYLLDGVCVCVCI